MVKPAKPSNLLNDTHGMLFNRQACYRALESHDARFDGRFFIAVRTTKIYCRPVCRVRLPRPENCDFYVSAAAAEVAGFRPCLRCRPELAPGWAAVDAKSRLAQAAAKLIEDGVHNGLSLQAIADRLGVSTRHMRRIFESEFGVSPIDYLQTRRLLLAKRLLTDTGLPVIDVAVAAGFGSVRRLNASMRERYRMNPSDLRRQRRVDRSADLAESLVFPLPVKTPFAWAQMNEFLAFRAIDGLEHVQGNCYARVITVRVKDQAVTGWLRARPARRAGLLTLEISTELAPVVAVVIGRARALFDLDTDPHAVSQALGELSLGRPGLRVPGADSGFEIAVRAVLGQQVTVKAARTLCQRFVRSFGRSCHFDALPELEFAFPEPVDVAELSVGQIAELGIIRRRAQTILLLAEQILCGDLVLDPMSDVDQTVAQLKALPGIGDWTAQYIAMRALRWPDAFPAGDYGVKKALNVTTAAQAVARAEAWRPWRAYAVMNLWASLKES